MDKRKSLLNLINSRSRDKNTYSYIFNILTDNNTCNNFISTSNSILFNLSNIPDLKIDKLYKIIKNIDSQSIDYENYNKERERIETKFKNNMDNKLCFNNSSKNLEEDFESQSKLKSKPVKKKNIKKTNDSYSRIMTILNKRKTNKYKSIKLNNNSYECPDYDIVDNIDDVLDLDLDVDFDNEEEKIYRDVDQIDIDLSEDSESDLEISDNSGNSGLDCGNDTNNEEEYDSCNRSKSKKKQTSLKTKEKKIVKTKEKKVIKTKEKKVIKKN
jgi:hypothetical protein